MGAPDSNVSNSAGGTVTTLPSAPRSESLVRDDRDRIEQARRLVDAANEHLRRVQGTEPQPLAIEPASALAGRNPPPERDAICREISLFAGRVMLFGGNGGFGKTTTAHQLAIAVASSRPLWGMHVNGGPVLAIFCEDEQPEVDRKTLAIAEAEGIDLSELDRLYTLSRDGQDNVLCSFEHDQIILTDCYRQLDATVAQIKPRLLIWDTAADGFAGDFMSTPHVRQFIKIALGGLSHQHGCAIVLLAHPSAAAMASGDGGGFSTAWNNSVRARLYLRRPKTGDPEAIADRRVLEVMKSNYGPTGRTIPLIYDRGRFALDPDPIEEGAAPVRASKANTRLSMAVMQYFRDRAGSGQPVAFGAVFDALKTAGDLPDGRPDTVRKKLQRTLRSLVDESLLRDCQVPRGYRIVLEQAQ